MKVNRKLIRNGVIAVLSVAVLGGGYYFALHYEPASEETEPTQATAQTITLLQEKTEDVRAVRLTNPTQSYTLYQDEEGAVSIPEYADIPMEAMRLKSAFSSFLSLYAEREITQNAENLSDFGLDRKDASLTIEKKNGEILRFYVGDTLPGETERYLIQENTTTVYALSSYKADLLFQSVNSYRNRTLFSLAVEEVNGFSLRQGQTELLSARPAHPEDHPLNAANAKWILETPCEGDGAAEDRLSSLIQTFVKAEVVDFADDHPSDLNTYGLGATAYTVTLQTAAQSYTLRIGAPTEDGVYIQCDDAPYVYLGDRAFYDTLSSFNPMQYVQKFVRIASIEDVASVEIQKDGKLYTLSIGEGSEEENEEKYQINGNTTKADNFKKIYQQIIGILFVDTADRTAAVDPLMTVTYRLKDGSEDQSRYYTYDERYYLAERSDGRCFTVLQSDLADLFKTLSAGS